MFAFLYKLFKFKWRPPKPLLNSLDKVQGISFEDWVYNTVMTLPENTVLLVNPDFTKKPSGFWNQIPRNTAKQFQEDLVILTTKNYQEAKKVWDSIDPDFALAYLVLEDHALINRQDSHSHNSKNS